MSQIAVRLTDSELSALDSVVAEGAYSTRAEAVRAGIQLVARESREERIVASYRSAYAIPLSQDESDALDAAAGLVSDALP